MSKHPTTAPKERINIMYASETNGEEQDVELPLKILTIGDYTGKAINLPLDERKPINIDKDTFSDVMRSQDLSVDICVSNHISDKNSDQLDLHLEFKTLRDFEPDALCRQVTPLRRLLEIRQALGSLKGPMGNIPEFRKKIQAALQNPKQRKLLQTYIENSDSEGNDDREDDL